MHPEFGPESDGGGLRPADRADARHFLLVAVGSLLNVLTGRLSRIVDRSRELQQLHGVTEGPGASAGGDRAAHHRTADARRGIINPVARCCRRSRCAS